MGALILIFLIAFIRVNQWLKLFLVVTSMVCDSVALNIIAGAGHCQFRRARLCNSGTLPLVCRLS